MPTGLDGNPHPLRTPARDALLDTIAREVLVLRPEARICVGIDGASRSGKSTFADELARRLEAAGRPVVRSTTDSFHNPRIVRYRRGRMSAEGYYRDSHDLEGIRRRLLDPFLAGQPFRIAAFDEPSDSPVDAPRRRAAPAAILMFDGLFIHRPELRGYWDYSIYLDASERERRGLAARYVDGWRLYTKECGPASLATRVVDNSDLAAPTLRAREAHPDAGPG